MRNFVEAYMTFCKGNEAPENYHLWSCLTALSSVVSRRVWLNQGIFRVYANLYTVLVGAPGNGKTTSMSISKRLIRELKDIPFSAECQTKESLVKEMCEYERAFEWGGQSYAYTPVAVFVTELSQFLGVESGHMIDFLTTVFDQDFYDRKTATKGSQVIVGPYLTILACATPKCITTYLKQDIISGGFSRRAIFVYEQESTVRIPFPEVTPEHKKAWDDLLKISRERLLTVKGEFVWEPEAKDWFASWYTSYKLPEDEQVRFYHRTKHVQLLKVAMLFSLAESNSLKLKKEHLQLALEALERIERHLPIIFRGIGRNVLNSVSSRILEVLHSNKGKLTEKQLMAYVWNDASQDEFMAAIRFLEETGAIHRRLVKIGGVDRIVVESSPQAAGSDSSQAAGQS